MAPEQESLDSRPHLYVVREPVMDPVTVTDVYPVLGGGWRASCECGATQSAGVRQMAGTGCSSTCACGEARADSAVKAARADGAAKRLKGTWSGPPLHAGCLANLLTASLQPDPSRRRTPTRA